MEAHGTGTSLGDPIEAAALGAVLSVGRADGAHVLIGSAKSNFGHLEAAAGILGLMKAVRRHTHTDATFFFFFDIDPIMTGLWTYFVSISFIICFCSYDYLR